MKPHAAIAVLFGAIVTTAVAQDAATQPPIKPLDGCAWLETDGLRAAWIGYKQVDDEMVRCLVNARVNAVFLRHGFHDLLDLETAHWKGDRIVLETRDVHLARMIENTRRAAAAGIHVFWLANYELEQMLPHLQRLGYQPAYAEGPARYLKTGPHRDAAPLDPVFWRGITGGHGELIARLSLEHPIDGLLYDTEHYAGGIMYMQNAGFSDATFQQYVDSRQLDTSAGKVPAGSRYEYLKSSGRLPDYYLFLEEQAYEQGRSLANRWHAINPHLVLGIWPLLDNWFSRGTLRGLGGAVPSLGLSGVEYYHGSDQSKSLAEFFESRCPNMYYVAGFYPPYSYSVDQLEQHVAQAIRTTRRYWMLGPHEQLAQKDYQAALRNALELATTPQADARSAVDLTYRVDQDTAGPHLVVQMSGAPPEETPLLSLHSSFGGAPLCTAHPMHQSEAGHVARVTLRRRITNNLHMSDGFRSGATYSFNPKPRELFYEDPHHTKLTDGRAYGYFGTTVAWAKTKNRSSVSFDLHRPYRIVRVEISQPSKLDDRIGGPTNVTLYTAEKPDVWRQAPPFEPYFQVSLKDVTEPDTAAGRRFDKRHDRAWLSWRAELPGTTSRWLRLNMERIRENSSISLGEVSVWADFEGEVVATIQSGGKRLPIKKGRRWTVTLPR
jgi:hypothetical protein